jgi:hypothetical protein
VHQLLFESLLIAVIGTVLGLAVVPVVGHSLGVTLMSVAPAEQITLDKKECLKKRTSRSIRRAAYRSFHLFNRKLAESLAVFGGHRGDLVAFWGLVVKPILSPDNLLDVTQGFLLRKAEVGRSAEPLFFFYKGPQPVEVIKNIRNSRDLLRIGHNRILRWAHGQLLTLATAARSIASQLAPTCPDLPRRLQLQP